jgi:glycosyltransferase involved in cell wall biosynthesis
VAVVPARDEADAVGHAIASLAAQRPPGYFHIVLVDDHSSDGTAAIAAAAAPPGLLTIVAAAPLPAGWTGKLWAVAEGVRHAAALQPDYLLLTDADIVHPPDNAAHLAARAESGSFDLVSYMATLACRTPAERALAPAFVFFFFLLYPPAWIRSARHATAGAAGGCMLIRYRTLAKNRRDRCHPGRAHRRLRARARGQTRGRAGLAGTRRDHPQHPALSDLR